MIFFCFDMLYGLVQLLYLILKKHVFFFTYRVRHMKYKTIYLLILAVVLSSCAVKGNMVQRPNPLPLMKAPEPVEISVSNPVEFEKSIPSSSILKKSLFVFENTYPRIYSDDGVLAVAAGEKLLAALKEDSLGFTMPYCSSLVTGGGYDRVKVEGYGAIIYGRDKIALFSAEECVRFAVHKRKLRGEVALIGDRVAEWEGSKVFLREALSGNTLFDGETGLAVATAGLINGETVLVHYNGYITYYDVNAKAFAFKGSFPVEFEALRFSEGKFYGIKKDTKEFFILTEKDSELTAYTDCVLSPSSAYALCGERLVGQGKSYDGMPKASDFAANGSFFADIKVGIMKVYSLQPVWQRFIKFDFDLPAPCLDEAEDVYFNDFSGEVIKLSKGIQSPAEKRPDKCNGQSVKIKNGEFLCKNKPCGVFAEKIMQSGGDTMFRRTENGKRYYFFNDLAPIDKVN